MAEPEDIDTEDAEPIDAAPIDTTFSRLERKVAEEFIILQRDLAKLNYRYVRQWLADRRDGE